MGDTTVMIGTVDGLYRLDEAEPYALAGRPVTHVYARFGDLWAVVDGEALVLNPGLAREMTVAVLTDEHANCALVTAERVLVGASHAALYELVDNELRRSRSFEDAPDRASWFTPWGGPPDVRSIAQGVEGNLYVNVHVGGVVRSDDRGTTWTDTMDINADVHEVIADPVVPGRAFVASAIGLGMTVDGGDSWTFTTDGLHSTYCRAVAASAGSVFVTASLGSQGQQAALYRRDLSGEGPLIRCEQGLPEWFSTNINTFCVAAHGGFVVAGDANGTVYISHDDGVSWDTAATDLPRINSLTNW